PCASHPEKYKWVGGHRPHSRRRGRSALARCREAQSTRRGCHFAARNRGWRMRQGTHACRRDGRERLVAYPDPPIGSLRIGNGRITSNVANSTIFHFGSSADDSLAGKTPAGRDAKGMQNVSLWVISGRTDKSAPCPLYPQ